MSAPCHDKHQPKIDKEGKKRILLIGNPNVGKSVIFSRLTGFEVVTANYSGTTVSYHEGLVKHQGEEALLIDVPGIYGLEATSKAERVAVNMLNEGADLLVVVLDATHLERNVRFAYECARLGLPMVLVLNLGDVAYRRGMSFHTKHLKDAFGVPVIETVAVKREGIPALKAILFEEGQVPNDPPEDTYEAAKTLSKAMTTYHEVTISWLEKLGDWAVKPLTGIPIAFVVMALAIGAVIGGGKALRSLLLLPFVNQVYAPFMTGLVSRVLDSETLFYNILVGEYGVLIKIIEWPFALIFPYVLLFFIVFSFLEDSGYLPRIGVLLDAIFRRFGLAGSNVIPFMMGYGCAVPAILGTRTAATQKERVISVTLITIAVPCTAQTGAFIVLLGDRSLGALLFVYLMSFMAIFFTGMVLNKTLKGFTKPMVLEIPNLLMPNVNTLVKKIWMKIKHYLKEAQGPMFYGILLAAVLVETGALVHIGRALEPLTTQWLGLPQEASLALILGIIRRELAVVPLIDMNLTTVQLITGSVVALFYIPCVSAFVVLVKELKLKTGLAIVALTFFFAFFFGGVIQFTLNFLLGLF